MASFARCPGIALIIVSGFLGPLLRKCTERIRFLWWMAILMAPDSVPIMSMLMLRRLFENRQPWPENPLLVRRWARTSLMLETPLLGRMLIGTL